MRKTKKGFLLLELMIGIAYVMIILHTSLTYSQSVWELQVRQRTTSHIEYITYGISQYLVAYTSTELSEITDKEALLSKFDLDTDTISKIQVAIDTVNRKVTGTMDGISATYLIPR